MVQERAGEQQRDISILGEVTNEWMKGAGADIAVRTVVSYLQELHQRFGEEFTIEGASVALDRLSQDALAIKGELVNKKTPSTNDEGDALTEPRGEQPDQIPETPPFKVLFRPWPNRRPKIPRTASRGRRGR